MVERLKDWPRILSDYLAELSKQPFKWGKNDCMASTCLYYERITGLIVFQEFEGYQTEEEAAAVLENHGGIAAILNRFLGPSHIRPLNAKRGDIVMVRHPHAMAGIVDDSGQRIALVTAEGLIRIPLSKAIRVWSV